MQTAGDYQFAHAQMTLWDILITFPYFYLISFNIFENKIAVMKYTLVTAKK